MKRAVLYATPRGSTTPTDRRLLVRFSSRVFFRVVDGLPFRVRIFFVRTIWKRLVTIIIRARVRPWMSRYVFIYYYYYTYFFLQLTLDVCVSTYSNACTRTSRICSLTGLTSLRLRRRRRRCGGRNMTRGMRVGNCEAAAESPEKKTEKDNFGARAALHSRPTFRERIVPSLDVAAKLLMREFRFGVNFSTNFFHAFTIFFSLRARQIPKRIVSQFISFSIKNN